MTAPFFWASGETLIGVDGFVLMLLALVSTTSRCNSTALPLGATKWNSGIIVSVGTLRTEGPRRTPIDIRIGPPGLDDTGSVGCSAVRVGTVSGSGTTGVSTAANGLLKSNGAARI